MSVYFSFLILCIATTAYSQSDSVIWADSGASWFYELRPEQLDERVSWIGFESLGDTIDPDDGVLSRFLQFNHAGWNGRILSDGFFVRQLGRQLFYKVQGEYELIYDFNKSIGDTLIIRHPEDIVFSQIVQSHDTVIIDSVGGVEIGGELRTMHYVTSLTGSDYGPLLVEGIGSLNIWWFPTYVSALEDLDILNGLRCYSDNNVGTVKYTSDECDLDQFRTNLNSYSNRQLRVYPNPVSQDIFIECANCHSMAVDYARLYDMQGNLLYHKLPLNESIRLDGLAVGVYILAVDNMHRLIIRK